jgi:uncharacterized protein DUF2237
MRTLLEHNRSHATSAKSTKPYSLRPTTSIFRDGLLHLSTPVPKFDIPGLKAGNRRCLCAARWQEELQAKARDGKKS